MKLYCMSGKLKKVQEMRKSKSIQAQTAHCIKKEIKNKFPNLKFRIKSSSFAGGTAVDIFVSDGSPSVINEVKEIAGKYEEGSYDSMEDIYVYSNDNPSLPQVNYTYVANEISLDVVAKAKKL